MNVIYHPLIILCHPSASLNFIRTQVNDCTYTQNLMTVLSASQDHIFFGSEFN
jgi:hypothetical protein